MASSREGRGGVRGGGARSATSVVVRCRRGGAPTATPSAAPALGHAGVGRDRLVVTRTCGQEQRHTDRGEQRDAGGDQADDVQAADEAVVGGADDLARRTAGDRAALPRDADGLADVVLHLREQLRRQDAPPSLSVMLPREVAGHDRAEHGHADRSAHLARRVVHGRAHAGLGPGQRAHDRVGARRHDVGHAEPISMVMAITCSDAAVRLRAS